MRGAVVDEGFESVVEDIVHRMVVDGPWHHGHEACQRWVGT